MKPQVLLVDDDSSILKSVSRLLAPDFEVISCSKISEARVAMKSHQFAIVVADQSLPDGRGIEFLAELKSLGEEHIRVLLTGSIDPAELVSAINDGTIQKLILKPWNNEYFKLHLLEALKSHQLLREKNALARLAITDPVTELNNHRRFQDSLKIELQRASRHNRQLSLLMIDIDHFKLFNDNYGHPAGDQLLRDVGKRILASVRSLDQVSRYGGEEFAVLMPDTSADDALRVAERIRLSFDNQPFDVFHHSPETSKITVSIGVASYKPNSNLVEAADQALYAAKNSGRNRSVLAD